MATNRSFERRKLTHTLRFHQQYERTLLDQLGQYEQQLAPDEENQARHPRLQAAHEAVARLEQTPPPAGFWEDLSLRRIGQQRDFTVAEQHLMQRYCSACWVVGLLVLVAVAILVIGVPLLVSALLIVALGWLLKQQLPQWMRSNASLRREALRQYQRLLDDARWALRQEELSLRHQMGEVQRRLGATHQRIAELRAVEAAYQEEEEEARLRQFERALLAELRKAPFSLFLPKQVR